MSRTPLPFDDLRPRRRPARAVLLGGVAATALLADRLGAGHRSTLVPVLAARPQATAALALASALLAGRRRTRPVAAAAGFAAAAGLAAAVAARAGQRPRRAHRAAPRALTEVTVLAANVLHGSADPVELARIIERATPDFVVLPEAGCDYRDKLMPLLELMGHRSWVSTEPGAADGRSITLLAAPRAGDVRVRAADGMRIRHLEATGGLLGARTLYAAHTAAPVGRAQTARWRHDLGVLHRWCAAPVAPLVVGDLNATLDHPSLRAALGGCRAAAGGGPRGLTGTFPTRLPHWLGMQIDHVLIPADALTSAFSIIDLPGSDHRAVLATVALRREPIP